MTEKVTKLALTSRLIILVLQCMANLLINDHKNDVFRAVIDEKNSSQLKVQWIDKLINICFGGLRHWDGEYFLHIAEHGYTYENTLAFYPLYPIIVGTTGRLLYCVAGSILNLRSCCLLMAITVNLLLFIKAANLLYQLTYRIFNDIWKSWHAAILFCFNPASIFFTAAYSETLFTVVTLYIMMECIIDIRLIRVTLMMSLSFISRSNGLLNIGFPIYYIICRTAYRYSKQTILNIIKCFIILIISVIPLTIYNFYTYQLYCNQSNRNGFTITYSDALINYGREKNFVIAGETTTTTMQQQSPWCTAKLPFPYSYVQSHYWQVGLFRYYQLKQLPNFLLALPILYFALWHTLNYLKYFFIHCYSILIQQQQTSNYYSTWSQIMKKYKILPFVIHTLILTIICICFVHIQISTRLLCSATPCLYWFAADYLPKSFDKLRLRSCASLILIWFAAYYLIGCVLFCNNLPWT